MLKTIILLMALSATKGIVPRNAHEGSIGTTAKPWLAANIDTVHAAVIFGAANYSTLSNVPSTFTPAAHNQDWSTIQNPPATYAPSAHNQAQSTINALAETLATRSLTSHNHAGTYLLIHNKPDSINWSAVLNPPATYAPSAHTQDWSTIQNPPSIPSAYDSAGAAGNSWKFGGIDTTTYKAHVLLGNAASATNATQHGGLDTTTLKAHTLLGKAADATVSDSARNGAGRLNGKVASLYMDSTQLVRTYKNYKIVLDTQVTIAAVRKAIFYTGGLATDRAYVSWADSVSGARKRGGAAAVCKANTCVVYTDTAAGTMNVLIRR